MYALISWLTSSPWLVAGGRMPESDLAGDLVAGDATVAEEVQHAQTGRT